VVEIDADRPFAVYADGERVAELPVRIELRASALSVIVPTTRA
jgi:diacylglycerol kinase family enzyme